MEVDDVGPPVPRDAALWLPPDQQEEWIALKKQVPTLTFAAFLAFNVLAWLSVRIINRKGAIKAPANLVLLKASICAATHAILSLAASAYALLQRDLAHCGQREFCVDDLSARMLTVHAGYALFEFLLVQNSAGVVAPWNEMLLLNDMVTLLMAVASLMYPSRLTLVLLPLQQLLQVATLTDCLRRFGAIYKAPWHIRFRVQLAFMGAYMAKAAGAGGLAVYVWYYIRSHGLWTLQLPEGMSALNAVYGMTLLGGCLVQAVVYARWVGAAIGLTNSLINAVEVQRDGAAAAAAQKTLTGNRKKQKGKQRR